MAHGRYTDMTRLKLFFLSMGLLLPLLAQAEPVEIQAGSMALDNTKSTVRFAGDVQLTQGDFKLLCDRLDGHYGNGKGKKSELQHAHAYGHVRLRQGGTTGTADEAELDNIKGQITLIGHAVLEQEGRRVEGKTITHSLKQQNTEVSAGKNARVRMTIESGDDNKTLIPDSGTSPKP